MDNRKRTSIFPGLQVAIVLKKDQPTGRLTYGEVSQILTSSDFHPRGIKVRLKDGQVGRVQQIVQVIPKSAANPPGLLVLVVVNPDGLYYAKRLTNAGGELYVLGLDSAVRIDQRREAKVRELMKSLGEVIEPPRLIVSSTVFLGEQESPLHGYVCVARFIEDPHAEHWDWVGWLSETELNQLILEERLSKESSILYARIRRQPE